MAQISTVQTNTPQTNTPQVNTVQAAARRSHHQSVARALILVLGLFGALIFFPQDVQAQDVQAQGVERSVNNRGVIAYATENHEIWIVNADGSMPRKLWEVPAPRRSDMSGVIRSLAWNKDGSTLAFVSGHEPLCSLYETNIYTINADGSDLQRITNRPDCDVSLQQPTGEVQVSLVNDTNSVLTVQVFVEGAPAPQTITLFSATPRLVTISDVPDLGPDIEQAVVAVRGNERWFHLPAVDVIAGETVEAGIFGMGPNNVVNGFRTWDVQWSPDNQTLGFLLGLGVLQQVPFQAGPMTRSTNLLPNGVQHAVASQFAWSPVDDTVLYTAFAPEGGNHIYRATAASETPAQQVIGADETRGMAFTPDGQGFVVANYFADFMTPVFSNLFHIDLESGQHTQLTQYENHFAFSPSVSPDGQEVVFHYAENLDAGTPAELRVIPIGGGEGTKFGPSGVAAPAWGQGVVNSDPDDETPDPDDETPDPDDETPDPDDETPDPDDETPNPDDSSHRIFLPFNGR